MSQYQRLVDKPSDCPCDWQMGGKKKDRAAQETLVAKPAPRGRDSEDAGSETSMKSGTSSEKRRLAQTRAELREAGEDALRMAAAHETPTETPIYETDRQTNFDRANPVSYVAHTGTPYRDLDDED